MFKLALISIFLFLFRSRWLGRSRRGCGLGLLCLLGRVTRGAEGGTGPAAKVVLYGWSLGAGLSIVGAAREPGAVAGVIAENPYRRAITPARKVLAQAGIPSGVTLAVALRLIGWREGVGVRWRGRGGFDRAEWAARMRAPLLVLHGEADLICPVEDGATIAAAAPVGTLAVIPDAGHHGLWTEARTAAPAAGAVAAFLGDQLAMGGTGLDATSARHGP